MADNTLPAPLDKYVIVVLLAVSYQLTLQLTLAVIKISVPTQCF